MYERTRRPGGRASLAGLAVLAVALTGCGDNGAKHDQNTLDPRGPDAEKILDLFTPFAIVAIAIGVLVMGAVVVAAVKFRHREGRPDNVRQVHGSTGIEIGWTVVPALILVVMAVPTVATIFDLAEKPANALEVTVTGKQWWWEYEYAKEGIVTANELHIPVGQPVYLTLQSDNVIHSFWVPNLAGKKDVVPGREHHLRIQADEEGVFLGQCAEYCGLSHADMRLRVVAQNRRDYDAWVATMQQPLVGTALTDVQDPARFAQARGCVSCHTFDGLEGSSAAIGPNLTHLGDRAVFAGGKYETNEENLTQWIYDAPSRKPNQCPDQEGDNCKVGMPSFEAAGMTEAEAREIARWLLDNTSS